MLPVSNASSMLDREELTLELVDSRFSLGRRISPMDSRLSALGGRFSITGSEAIILSEGGSARAKSGCEIGGDGARVFFFC